MLLLSVHKLFHLKSIFQYLGIFLQSITLFRGTNSMMLPTKVAKAHQGSIFVCWDVQIAARLNTPDLIYL